MCKLYSSIKYISSDIIDDASHASLPPDKALSGWVTFIIQFYPVINAVTLVGTVFKPNAKRNNRINFYLTLV
jgi:hypothetical protein